jgi:hypothetical protein
MSKKRELHPTDKDLSVGTPDLRHPLHIDTYYKWSESI